MTAAKLRIAQAGFFGLMGLTWWLGHHDTDRAPATVGGGPFTLRDVTADAGIDFRHEPFEVSPSLAHIDGQIAATGAGVSIVDVDGDGWPDLFATTSRGGRPNALYLNQGDGTFRDVAAEAGLAHLNEQGVSACMGSIWADVDGDGDRDAYVYAYGRSFLMLQEPGLTFRDATDEAGLLGPRRNTNAAAFIDYDRDGDLDLYVAGYWRDDDDLWSVEHSRVMHNSFEFANDGGTNALYRNDGGRFVDVTAETGTTSTRWTYAVAAADIDDDGWTDLYLANDYGSEELLINQQGRGFEKVLGAGLEEDSKSGMCVALGDVDNQGRTAVYVTNISEARYLFQGNNLRINLLEETGRLLDVAEGAVADCGWAWGAQFVDLDNDGWQDLYVSNGMISDDEDEHYWYAMSKISGALGGVVADAKNWPALEGRSLSGYERSRVLHNQGRGRGFREVGAQVGVSDTFDGRAVAVGDLFGDGTPDVVVANQRGPLLVYRSEPVPGRHGVQFDLVGAPPNTSAIGATVYVTAGDHVQRHVVTSSVGFSAQNDHRVHVGLGTATQVDELRIRWPSGEEQVLHDLAADTVHRIEEPRP